MKIKEFEEKLSKNPSILDFKLAHDLGNKLIYTYTYSIGETAYESSVAIIVKDRGKNTEKVYVIGTPPPFLMEMPELERRRDEIVKLCDIDLLESFSVNTIGNYAVITGYKLVENKYVRKTFIATIRDEKISVHEAL